MALPTRNQAGLIKYVYVITTKKPIDYFVLTYYSFFGNV